MIDKENVRIAIELVSILDIPSDKKLKPQIEFDFDDIIIIYKCDGALHDIYIKFIISEKRITYHVQVHQNNVDTSTIYTEIIEKLEDFNVQTFLEKTLLMLEAYNELIKNK